jgi:bifunctional NMN adenylyltransferase/nudix hydrolase
MLQTKQQPDVGIIVARFQSPYLHEGHLDVINQVRSSHARTIIFLGCAPLKFTKKNPYDFSIRRAMVEESFPDVEVYAIDDVGDDAEWSRHLDAAIGKVVGPQLRVALYGSRDSFTSHYTGNYPTFDLIPTVYISASDVRRRTGIKPKFGQQFREGMAYVLENQYVSCMPTVDVAIIDMERERVLLARKPGRTLLCFVGGFADVGSPSYEADGIREVMEETKLSVTDLQYAGSCLIDDIRYRSETNKIKIMNICLYIN